MLMGTARGFKNELIIRKLLKTMREIYSSKVRKYFSKNLFQVMQTKLKLIRDSKATSL